MKKGVLFVGCICMSVMLTGCRWQQESSDAPPRIKDDGIIIASGDRRGDEGMIDTGSVVDSGVVRDEFDEQGEFDPNTFQDDDIDAVMDLLRELTAEE